jgi:hypothetical protein
MDPARAIADAVLYEGYVLWPYRRSALKNARRWTFGGVYPRAHSAAHPDDPWVMQTECLAELGAAPRFDVRMRFLHPVERQVMRVAGSALEPVDAMEVGARRYLTWTEAVERETRVEGASPADLTDAIRVPIAVEASSEDEEILDEGGAVAGALRRTWRHLEGELELAGDGIRPGLIRLRARITNTTPFDGGTREDALERTFCSTHSVLSANDAEFVSLTDPPDALAAEARACRNEGAWPVLVGERGDRHTVLSAPIILEDHPRIAPESPGDLFDGGEIDQLLTLNILALTDEEKEEMRATDPRTREVLERTETLTPDQMMSLHGAIREFGMVRRR